MDSKLDKSFGPSGTFGGYVIMVSGIISFFFVDEIWASLAMLVIGAFAAFTITGTEIDLDSRKLRYYTAYFGLFKSGKWQSLGRFDQIQIVNPIMHSRSYSRSNRTLDIYTKDYRILLLGRGMRLRVTLQRHKSYKQAELQAVRISKLMNIPFVKAAPKEKPSQ